MTIKWRILMTVLVSLAALSAGEAVAGGIGFRNDLKIPIFVQGYTNVNGMKRFGQPILIKPGQIGWDNKLPNLPRIISIYDANQPNQAPLLRDIGVPFQGFDLFFGVNRLPNGKMVLVPEKAPMMPQ